MDSVLQEEDTDSVIATYVQRSASKKKQNPLDNQKTAVAAGTYLSQRVLSTPSNPRSTFFVRGFSTKSLRGTSGVARYISRRNRLFASDLRTASAFVSVASRYQIKGRAEARGRSSFTARAR